MDPRKNTRHKNVIVNHHAVICVYEALFVSLVGAGAQGREKSVKGVSNTWW